MWQKAHAPRNHLTSICDLHSSFICLMVSTFTGDDIHPYAMYKCPTKRVFDCPNVEFSHKNVRCASSNFCKTFSQSTMWSTMKPLQPFQSMFSSLSVSKHPFMGISSRNDMVILGCNLSTPCSLHSSCRLKGERARLNFLLLWGAGRSERF